MARIISFVYCEDAKHEITPTGNKGVLINPMASLLPQFIPGSFSFSVAICIQGLAQGTDHKLTYTFSKKDDTNTIIGNVELPFRVDSGPDMKNIPEEYQGIVFNLEFKNVVFRSNGEYISRVFVDDEMLGEYPISVHGRENL